MYRIFFVFMPIVILASSCTSQYAGQMTAESLESVRLKSSYIVSRNAEWTIHATTPIYLAYPTDLAQADRRRNILALSKSLGLALQQVFPSFTMAQKSSNLTVALHEASMEQAELLFWPNLVSTDNQINDRQELLEGSALHPEKNIETDKAVFQVLIYEVRTKKLLDVASVASRSRMFATKDSLPSDLFEKAAKEYVFAITGKGMG